MQKWLLGWVFCATATVVPGLYQATVPVESADAASRHAYLKYALEQVLVKVSGTSDVITDPKIQAKIQSPESYVHQFSYSQNAGSYLQAEFNVGAVDALLKNERWPIWDASRPFVLLVICDEQGKMVTEEATEWVQSLQYAAHMRGLPVAFPIMDFEDRQAMPQDDIRAHASTILEYASQRYGADAVIIGSYAQDGILAGEFALLDKGGASMPVSLQAPSMGELSHNLVENVSNLLAERYATSNQVTDLILVVDGIKGFADHAEIQSALGSLKPTAHIRTLGMNGTRATFQVKINGTPSTLIFAAHLNNKLKVVSEEPLIFEWKHG